MRLKQHIIALVFALCAVLPLSALQDVPDFEDYRRVGEVLQPFSRNKENNTYGVTLRTRAAAVHTLAGGKVYSAGRMRGYGRYVIVDHGHGWHTLYSNLARIDVKAGQQLPRGATLGMARHKRLFLVVSYRGNPINPSDVNGHRDRLMSAAHRAVPPWKARAEAV